MAKHEAFKRRIRERMETTGERYTAARQALINSSTGSSERIWVSPPEVGNDALLAKTGRGWDDWCDLIEAWPEHTNGHQSVVKFLREQHDVAYWWSQTIAVGYERIVGLRLPSQLNDGTFTVNKSMTIDVDATALRELLLDEQSRKDLFPDEPTVLRSKVTSKSIRLGFEDGVALITISPTKVDGRCKVVIAHEQLPTLASAEQWRFYWAEWLDALDDARI